MSTFSRRALLRNTGRLALAGGAVAFSGPLLSGCSSGNAKSSSGGIGFQFMGNTNQSDSGVVQDAMNAYLKSKGKDFTIVLTPVQNYSQAMTLAMTADSESDVFFTAPWANDYYRNVGSGNLMALDDLLPKYAPKLWKSMPASVWDAARVNGKIYGVINQQRFPKLWGFVVQQKLAEQHHLDVDAVTSFAELEPFLAAVKQSGNGITPWATDLSSDCTVFHPELYGWDPVASAYGIAVRYDDAGLTAFNMYDTPEFRTACALIRGWQQKGYAVASPPSQGDMNARMNAGRIAVNSGQVAPTNPQYWQFPTLGKSLVPKPILNTDGVCATLNGIRHNASRPEQAIEFLELLNSDKDFYNLMCFGVEGKHYVFTDKALGVVGLPAGQTAATSKWNPNMDWAFGNQFNAYYRDLADAKAKRWQVEARVNAQAVVSKAIGFSLDTTKVKTQVATVSAAMGEYLKPLMNGLVDPGNGISTLLSRTEQAGLPAILKEVQAQLDKLKSAK
ncbi:ABC transporter substrate-binding protein [Kribbella sp. NPDC059898]|uniref:ABC transporter substrate-binding protein n=1 Tax=Kribbella sp. NPDC059898 TaxID=3346995 RepID=UPI003658CD9D